MCCCRALIAVCRRPTCAAFVTVCAACGIAGATVRWQRMRWCNTSRHGLPMLKMQIRGACAMPSFAVAGSILKSARRGSLTARQMGVCCAAVRGTTPPGTRARRTATTTRPATGTTTTVSVLPARPYVPEPCPLRRSWECQRVSTGRHDECRTPPSLWRRCLGQRGRFFRSLPGWLATILFSICNEEKYP